MNIIDEQDLLKIIKEYVARNAIRENFLIEVSTNGEVKTKPKRPKETCECQKED